MSSKRIPIDCKRLREKHLKGLGHDELGELVERIEIQTQALNRARRLVAQAVDHLDSFE